MLAGAEIGKYRLEKRLARGGMAEVWAASVRGPGDFQKAVALKFILAHFDNEPEAERLFFQEARLAASFAHANLVSVFDFDRIPETAPPALAGRHFIAMENVDGGTLWQLTQAHRDPGIPEAQVVHVAVEALKGLSYLHEHGDMGLVHRDLSPQNILLSRSGQVKISDFGVAKATAKLSAARSNVVYGKLPYFAPEIVSGANASCASDLFALGVVLWETLSGRPLFLGKSDAETLQNIRSCHIPWACSGSGTRASEPFQKALESLLRESPHDRVSSASEALSAFLAVPSYDPSPAPLARLVRSAAGRSAGDADSPANVSPSNEELAPPSVLPPTQRLVSVGHTKVLPNGPAGDARGPVPQAPLYEAATSEENSLRPATAGQAHGYINGFSDSVLSQKLSLAFAKFELARGAGPFNGTFEEWVLANSENGIDPISGQRLPVTFKSVISWPRFADLGWKVRLSPEWQGPRPWGDGGFWVAEDRLGQNAMVIFPNDLQHAAYKHVSRDAWLDWWAQREVDILSEGPLESKTPVSTRARSLLMPGDSAPQTVVAWARLLSERDPEAASTDIRRRTKSASATKSKRTFWQRLFQGEVK